MVTFFYFCYRLERVTIRCSNLELKDKKVRITAKKLFVFFKQVEKTRSGEIDWLEPENGLITWDNQVLPPVHSHMERDTGVEPVFSPWEGDVEPLN